MNLRRHSLAGYRTRVKTDPPDPGKVTGTNAPNGGSFATAWQSNPARVKPFWGYFKDGMFTPDHNLQEDYPDFPDPLYYGVLESDVLPEDVKRVGIVEFVTDGRNSGGSGSEDNLAITGQDFKTTGIGDQATRSFSAYYLDQVSGQATLTASWMNNLGSNTSNDASVITGNQLARDKKHWLSVELTQNNVTARLWDKKPPLTADSGEELFSVTAAGTSHDPNFPSEMYGCPDFRMAIIGVSNTPDNPTAQTGLYWHPAYQG